MAETATHAMTEPRVSLETATWWFDRAGFALIAGTLVVLASTVTIVWLGIEKEHHWDLARDKAGKQIAELNVQAEKLRKDTAEANARALEAQLALAKFKAPRRLHLDNSDELDAFTSALKVFAGTEWDALVVPNNVEAATLLREIELTLPRAGWVQIDWKGRTSPVPRDFKASVIGPLPTAFGGMFTSGTMIVVHPEHTSKPDSPTLLAATALADALNKAGVECAGVMGMDVSANRSAVHVLIAAK